LGIDSKSFVLQFSVDIFPQLEPDPESQNLADPDPWHLTFTNKLLNPLISETSPFTLHK